jgi:flagellar basal-body rod modification protein FlgD
VTTTNGVTSSTGTTYTASTARQSTDDPNAVDKDMFLKLLVAQLKYQDPNNATDPSEFLSQTAQFTTVEKLNDLEALSQKVYDSSRQQTATAMVGQTVTYTAVSGKSATGVVTAVSVGSSTPNLTVGGVQVSLDSVTAVAAPTTS